MAFKTPISILEELVVSKRQAPPNYTFENIGNQFNPEFRCTVSVLSVSASDIARNKKDAKQKTAAKALELIYELDDEIKKPDQQNTSNTTRYIDNLKDYFPIEVPNYYNHGTNYVGLLNEYAAKNRCITAVSYQDSQAAVGYFHVSCIFGTEKTEGYGRNKKQAKQIAACEMLNELKQSNYIPPADQILKKIEFADSSSSIAIEKYKELSPSGVIKKEVEGFEPLDIKENKYSLEEARDMLEKLDLNYRVETIQKDPFLVAVHTDGPVITMGIGKDENAATADAMNQTLSKLKAGCSGIATLVVGVKGSTLFSKPS